jgi:hypothetical protein
MLDINSLKYNEGEYQNVSTKSNLVLKLQSLYCSQIQPRQQINNQFDNLRVPGISL